MNEKFEIDENTTSINEESNEKVKNDRGSLNAFLILVMCLGVFGTIIQSISNIVKYKILIDYEQQYFGEFCFVTVIFALIHIVGITFTLYRKSILGIWIIFGNLWLFVLLSFLSNSTLGITIFDLSSKIIQGILQPIIISLLLLLKSDNKSAWTLLMENYKNDLKQRKVTQNDDTIENKTIDTIAPLIIVEKVAEISTDDEIQKNAIEAMDEELMPENAIKNEIIDEKTVIQPKIKHRKPKTWFYIVIGISVIIVGIIAYWQITEHKKKEKEKEEQIDAYFQKANEAYNNKLYAVSIGYYHKIIDIDSSCFKAYSEIGRLYSSQENYEKAIEYFEKAILSNPNDSTTYLDLGDVYYCKENYNKAIEFYTKALEINPGYIDAYNSLGFVYTIKGDYQQAMAYLQQAIKLGPTKSLGYAYIGYYYNKQEKYDKALEFYKKSLEIEKKGWTYKNMATTYYSLGNYQKQEECIIRGASLNDEICQEWCRENGIEWEK